MMTTQEIIDAMSKSLPGATPYCTMAEAIRSLAVQFGSHFHYLTDGSGKPTSTQYVPHPGMHKAEVHGTKATAAPATQTDKPSEWAQARTKSILAKSTVQFSARIDFASDTVGYVLTAKEIALALDGARDEALEQAARIADGVVSGTEKTPVHQVAHDLGWLNAARYIARTIRARKEPK